VPKYDALKHRLARDGRPVVVLGCAELDELLPGGLPPSARRHRAWWSNETTGGHVQARAWLVASYVVAAVDLPEGPVTFMRNGAVDA
jgi:hypothetical protein